MKNKSVNKHIFQEAFEIMNSERNSIFIDELEHKIGEAVLKTKGVEVAYVTSAVDFTDNEKKRLENELTSILKRDIKIYYQIEPYLLGGFRINVGDWKIDGTLLYQLERMKRTLGGKT